MSIPNERPSAHVSHTLQFLSESPVHVLIVFPSSSNTSKYSPPDHEKSISSYAMVTDGFKQSFDMIKNTASKSPTLEPLSVLWTVAVTDVSSVFILIVYFFGKN